MAIDPRIPLGVQPMQIRSPLAVYGDVERIRALDEARAERAAERAEREQSLKDRQADRAYQEQGRARDQAKRDVFAKTPRKADGSLDYQRLSGEVAGLDPEASMSLAKYGQQEETADLQHRKALLDHDREQLAYISQVVGSAQDQPSWDAALARLAERKIPVQGAPRAFDPRVRDQIVQQGMTHAERVNAELAKMRASANIQSKTIKYKGRGVEVPFNPDTGEYTLPDGTKSKFAEHYERPESGGGSDDVGARQAAADKRDRERQADKWKADAIADLNKERRKPRDIDPLTGESAPGMTSDQYADAMRTITSSWKEMRDGPAPPPAAGSTPSMMRRQRIDAARLGGGDPGATRLADFGQPPVAPPVRPPPAPPASPMGPSAAAASPTMPASAQPPMNAPSTPTMNTNTPPTTNQRATPPSVTPQSTPPQHGEQRPLKLPDGSQGEARFNAQTGKWIRVR